MLFRERVDGPKFSFSHSSNDETPISVSKYLISIVMLPHYTAT